MPVDGPIDPAPAGANASSAEGNIFSRLRAPKPTGDAAPRPESPVEVARETAGAGHGLLDSENVNPGVLAASRALGGGHEDDASRPGSAGASAVGTMDDSQVANQSFTNSGPDDADPSKAKSGERLAVLCFAVTVLGVIGFVAAFILGRPHAVYYNPLLGSTMGIALLGVGAGGVVWAKYVMPHEDAVQERHPPGSTPQDQLAAQDVWRRGVEASGFVSRPMLRRSLIAASGALGLLAIVPLRSLAKLTSNQNAGALAHTHWYKGARLLQVPSMVPLKPGDLAIGALATVIPEGTQNDDEAQADSVAIIVRLRPEDLHPVEGRTGLDWNGHVVFSKVCTHLGCPVSLYESQTHRLLCPCHQSQFLVTESARPIFGPADRRLPQLALTVNEAGYFVSREADFPEPIGPSYWERT